MTERTNLQIYAFEKDIEDFKKLKDEYRSKGMQQAVLFSDLLKAFREKQQRERPLM